MEWSCVIRKSGAGNARTRTTFLDRHHDRYAIPVQRYDLDHRRSANRDLGPAQRHQDEVSDASA